MEMTWGWEGTGTTGDAEIRNETEMSQNLQNTCKKENSAQEENQRREM